MLSCKVKEHPQTTASGGFYAKPALKNFVKFTLRKYLVSDKSSVEKMFLMVDRAVKVTYFYIDQHLL